VCVRACDSCLVFGAWGVGRLGISNFFVI